MVCFADFIFLSVPLPHHLILKMLLAVKFDRKNRHLLFSSFFVDNKIKSSHIKQVIVSDIFLMDFKTQLTSILGKNPEVVFCPNYYQEVGQILAQAESVGLTVPFLGGDGWDGLEGYATADQLKDSYFCACYAKGSSAAFEDAYKAEYGEAYPNGFAPLGYDAAMTVVYGIKAAEEQGLEAGSDEYKQAVIDAIAGGTIEGITGTFTFDEHHNPVKSTAILTYVDGKPELKEMF